MAWIDFAICLFFGYLGVHKFREHKTGMGILYLFTIGLCGIGWIYDSIRYLIAAIKGERLNAPKKLNPSQQAALNNHLRILKDCLRIIQETANLDTFFSRYKLAETQVAEIAALVGPDTPCIGGETPTACMVSLVDQKEKETNECLERYVKQETIRILKLTRGRRAKALAVAAIINEYADDMPEACLDHGLTLANDLTNKIYELEGIE